ncbi:MAG: hypothetical protein A3F72_00175 [Bacteroidetes bacterium RIFCSPLOWO2_12_FULL_35_15]|nr:MAG: hypothetical protein A3F72_00175 [Bacteroidetes bacterium RIFCSPLOWO2_12_FULL_35_15]
MSIISLYSDYLQYQLLNSAEAGIPISEDYANSNDTRQRIIGIVSIIVAIASIIIFIMWFYRAYKNLHALKIPSLNHTPGWAIGAWFVPILNLGRPYVIMREIWDETQYFVLDKNEKQNVSSNSIVGWWWGLWLLHNFSGRIYARIASGATTIAELKTSTGVAIIIELIEMVTMIVTLMMLNRMFDYENKFFEFVSNQRSQPLSGEKIVSPQSMDVTGI